MTIELEVGTNRGYLEVLVDGDCGPGWVQCPTMEKLLEVITTNKVIAISMEPGD